MKTALKIAAGVGALSALSGIANVAHAQNSATATAAGTTTIVQAISVTKSTDLGFGTIVKPASGTATVSVDSAGARTLTGTVAANATGVSRALFNVNGEGGSVFSIAVPTSFSMTNGANSLVVTTSSSAASLTLSGSAGSQGSNTFGVGGSFNLTSSTPSGAYTGNFVVTVSYN